MFDPSRGAGTPKARFAYLFPNRTSSVIQVRLKQTLSDAQRSDAIKQIRAAVAMPQWKLDKASYTVTGAPVVLEDLADALAGSVLRLLVVALVVMALVLALVFRSRLRIVPLLVALAAVAVTFGAMALVGAPLTMASIAVLPVLLGLGVDYAIQFQARVEEEGGDAERAARVAGPTIATAALATGVGFLVLQLSPVPMVRGFGALLVVGIVFALLLAFSAGTAALALSLRHDRDGVLARSLRGAGELADAARAALARPAARAGVAATAVLRGALLHPQRVLAVGLALAAIGWAVDSQTEVVTDVERLVPQDLPAVRDLQTLQRSTGVAGEVDVIVEGQDLTDPKVVAWMRQYQSGLLKKYGYSATNGCGKAELCPALSLTDLFRDERAAATKEQVRGLLDAVPPYFSQSVITADRKTANLAFGVRLVPLDRQQEIFEDMRARLKPPPGVTASLGGLPVLVAGANHNLSDPLRRLGTLLAGLLAVALALLAVYRRWERALVPLVPIALATGWSALVLFAIRIPLNPMSATLSALVIAISTEFSVLLTARFREERAAGLEAADALRATYASTGAAVLASGATAIAGFAVLAFSDVAMLRDFGIVTVVDLTVSLLGVLAVLPAVLVLAERRAERAGEPTRRRPRPSRRERHRPTRPVRRPRAGRGAAAAHRAEASPSPASGATLDRHLDRRRRRRVRDRLHHAQHDPHGRAGLARRRARRAAAAVRGAAGALEPGRRREPRDEARPGRPGRPARLRGARAGRPQLVRARREGAGRDRVRREPLGDVRPPGRCARARARGLSRHLVRRGGDPRRPRRAAAHDP